MYYKVILSNTKDTIPIHEDELESVLAGIKQGRVAITRNGIFNPSYFVAIVVDKEREKTEAELKPLDYKLDQVSPFAKVLGKQMKMLSDKEMNEVNEEVARIERSKKYKN